MTPQEKAQELVDRFYQTQCDVLLKSGTAPLDEVEYRISKQCAIIAVEEVLNLDSVYHDYEVYNYWDAVKVEIKNL